MRNSKKIYPFEDCSDWDATGVYTGCIVEDGSLYDSHGELLCNDGRCMDEEVPLSKDAIDLINRQKEEIERLHNILLSFTNEVHTWSNKNGYDTTGLSLIPILNEAESVRETIKAEAVKEFAERLKTYYRNLDKTAGALIEYHIDEIVKEMLEGNVCGANTGTEK